MLRYASNHTEPYTNHLKSFGYAWVEQWVWVWFHGYFSYPLGIHYIREKWTPRRYGAVETKAVRNRRNAFELLGNVSSALEHVLITIYSNPNFEILIQKFWSKFFFDDLIDDADNDTDIFLCKSVCSMRGRALKSTPTQWYIQYLQVWATVVGGVTSYQHAPLTI